MTHFLLSPGAQRVVDRLKGLEICTAACVLRALWIDESRAHESLSQAGVQVPADSELDSIQTHPHLQWPMLDFLRGAQLHASQEGQSEEIRTEHLLSAALEIAPFGELLHAMQVDVPALREKLRLPAAAVSTPLKSDIQLRHGPAIRTESSSVARVLDAAANRCREGLRVVEDYTRMILNDGHLSRQIKEIRHALPPLLSRMQLDNAIQFRDTEHDVGTTIHTAFEMARPSIWSVVTANIKRTQEALRTLEEYGKTRDALAATAIGSLRYRFYTVEKGLNSTHRASEQLKESQLYLLVTDNQCPQGAGPVVKAALRGGVDVVQLREKDMPDRRFLDLALWIRQWTAEAGALFIVNDRPDLAVLAQADGVHVGQGDLSVHEARQILGGDKLIGVSTHAIEQARQAVLDGADYIGVGPVFASRTKSFEAFSGLNYVEQIAAEITLPAFAIGGIGIPQLADVLGAGARRIAVSSEICRAEDPERMAVRFKEALQIIQRSENENR